MDKERVKQLYDAKNEIFENLRKTREGLQAKLEKVTLDMVGLQGELRVLYQLMQDEPEPKKEEPATEPAN